MTMTVAIWFLLDDANVGVFLEGLHGIVGETGVGDDAEIQPTKLYYDTACFRYEKPQSGRLREFHQFGVEIFGTPNMMADSDVICLGHDFIEEMGIRDVVLEINSVGCPSCRTKYKKALQDFLKRPLFVALSYFNDVKLPITKC